MTQDPLSSCVILLLYPLRPTAERERHLDNRDGNRERERERERERFPDKDRLGAERAGEKVTFFLR